MPPSSPLPLILNPMAGTSADLEQLRAALERHWELEILATERAGHARELAAGVCRAGKPHLLVAGGDGTIHEAINGLADEGFPAALGAVPLGTGNDLARSLYACEDKLQIIDILARRQTQRIDVLRLRAGGRVLHVANHSNMGFSALLAAEVSSNVKRWIGAAAYPVALMRKLPELTAYSVLLSIDDRLPEEAALLNLTLSNGRTLGGGALIAPHASLTDGWADLLIVPNMMPATALNLLPTLLTGDHIHREELRVERLRRLRIQSSPPLPLQADGEFLGYHEEIEFELLEGALELIVDPQAEACGG